MFSSTAPVAQVVSNEHGMVDLAALAGADPVAVVHLAYVPQLLALSTLDALRGPLLPQPRTYGLPEVVIAANRFQENKRDVPEQIAVIKARDISLLDQASTGDLLQNSGALFVQKSQAGGGSPVIRGFEASRVLLVVDGVRMNNAIYRSGHLQDIMTVDQNALERIEVISGPASVVYGSDALGGVIHLMTRSATFSDTSGLRVGAGAFSRYSSANNERTVHADLSLATRRFSSFTSITASDFGDLRQGRLRNARYSDFGKRTFFAERRNRMDTVLSNSDPDVQIGTAYRQLDLLQKLRFRSGARTMHQLNMQLSTSSNVPRYDRLTEYSTSAHSEPIPRFAAWYYGPQQRVLLAYTLELEKRPFFDQARVTPSFQTMEQSRHSRSFGSNALGSRTERVNALGLNADFEKRFKAHEVRYGVELYTNSVTSQAQRSDIVTGAVIPFGSRNASEDAKLFFGQAIQKTVA